MTNKKWRWISAPKPAGRRARKPGVDRKPRQAYSAKQLEQLEAEFKASLPLYSDLRILLGNNWNVEFESLLEMNNPYQATLLTRLETAVFAMLTNSLQTKTL